MWWQQGIAATGCKTGKALLGRLSETLMEKSRPYSEHLKEAFAVPLEAASYLNTAMEEGDKELFLLALRNVAEARLGGMSKLAEATGLNRESLYRMLSGKGNPELKSLDKLLHALGLKIAVEVDEDAA
jgi:probable addiction module antidote protein